MKMLRVGTKAGWATRAQVNEVFLLLFLQKKKALS
jgi:hypothetical protein